jgi:NADP oxidoreductase coenzyme F420-dependent
MYLQLAWRQTSPLRSSKSFPVFSSCPASRILVPRALQLAAYKGIACNNFSTSTNDTSSAVKSVSSSGTFFNRIAMVGAGKMAQAFMEPMISKGVQPADKLFVYDVSIQALDDTKKRLGVQTTDTLREVVDGADLVILAVKPQNLTDSFFSELRKGTPNDNAIVLSIIAGKTMSEFSQTGLTKIVRSMPNTPAMIGQGMTVWSCTPNLTKIERQKIRDVLSSCGQSVCVC